jgi:hypothetical protein
MRGLNEMVLALDASQLSLRRDNCGDYRINGKHGHVYADGAGFLLCVSGGGAARWWTNVKRRLSFCRVTQDGHDEGCLHLDRLPAPAEAEVIRDALGIRRKRHLSPEAMAKAMAALRLVNFPDSAVLGGSTIAETHRRPPPTKKRGGRPMNTEQRIAALESENHDLRNRLAVEAGQQPKKVPPRRVEEDRPLITTFPTTAHLRHLPNAAEAAALLRIVTARFPTLKFRNATGELESFRCALAYVTSLTKTSAPTTKFAASWHVDAGQQWCRENGVQGIIRGLLPAIIGSGDISYSLDDPSAVWFDPYRSSGRSVDAQKWRQLLNGGDLLPPTKLNVFIDHSIGLQRTQSAW